MQYKERVIWPAKILSSQEPCTRPAFQPKGRGVVVAFAPTIRVYDWDGNHVCDLSADIPLLSICVSSDDSYLIGLYSDDYVLKCCRFDLPERLRE